MVVVSVIDDVRDDTIDEAGFCFTVMGKELLTWKCIMILSMCSDLSATYFVSELLDFVDREQEVVAPDSIFLN